jgi:hypothetical protein
MSRVESALRALVVFGQVIMSSFDIVGNTSDPYRDGEKYIVTSVDGKGFNVSAPDDLFAELTDSETQKSLEWTFAKDDVEPHELFRPPRHVAVQLDVHGLPSTASRTATSFSR